VVYNVVVDDADVAATAKEKMLRMRTRRMMMMT